MADKTAPAGPSGNVPDLACGEARRRCRVHRMAAAALALVAVAAAAAVVQSFVPRGHRGRRRLRRERPWHRRPVPDVEDEPRP